MMYTHLYFLFFFNSATSIQLFYFSKYPQILDQKPDSVIFNDGPENSDIKLKSEHDEGSKNLIKNQKYSISAKCEMLASKGIRDVKCEALRQGPLYYFQQTVRPKPKPVFTNFMPLSLNNLHHQYDFVDLTRDDFSMDYIDDVFRTGQISEREKRQALECKLLSLVGKAPEECAHRRSRGRRELLNVDNNIDPEPDLKSHTRFKVIDGKHSKDFRGNNKLKNKRKKVTTEATNLSSESDDTESEQSQKDNENLSKSDSSISEENSKTSRPDNDMVDLLQNDWESATEKPVKPKKTSSEENIKKSPKHEHEDTKPQKYVTDTNPDESESEEPEVQNASKESEVPKKYASKESEVPKKYASKESEVPKKYSSKESVVPKKKGSKKSVVPKKNGSKELKVPKKNGSKESKAPKKNGSKASEAPKKNGSKASEAPKKNGSKASEGPKKIWSKESAIPKKYWSLENSAEEKASGSTEVKNQLTDLDWSTSVEEFKEKYSYLQGHTYLRDSRKRLNQFLPKRTYWDDRQIRHLTNFWFNTAPYE